MELSSNISYIKGIGPKQAITFANELDIRSVEDLLYYFPYKYIDRSRFYSINEITSDASYIQLRGRIKSFETIGVGRNMRLEATLFDSTGTMKLVWFKGIQYYASRLSTSKEYIVFGKPSLFNGAFNIAHPEMEEATPNNLKKNLGWQAVYNTTAKMKSAYPIVMTQGKEFIVVFIPDFNIIYRS